MNQSRTHLTERVLLAVWFILNLVMGALTVHEYGVSLDEPNNYRYANDTINAYPSFFGTLYEPKYRSTYDGHGPAYVTIVDVLVRILQRAFPAIYISDVRHFLYFVTFQLMGLCLYWLTRRWFSCWTAWATLILFGTQPLLLGHSFMNPKDTPFMFLFTLSIALGFRFADGLKVEESFISLEGYVRTLKTKLAQADLLRKQKFVLYMALAATAMFSIFVFSRQINSGVEQIVTFFYTAGPDSWTRQVFDSFASQSSNVSLENYVEKALKLLQRVKSVVLIVGLAYFVSDFGLLINNTDIPNFLRNLRKKRNTVGKAFLVTVTSRRSLIKVGLLKIWFTDLYGAMRNPQLIFAGIVLGFATAVRPIAPLAGLIVVCHLFVKRKAAGWATTLAYFLIAGIVTYIAWPHLWGAPIQRYFESLGVVSNFSHFSGRVLFDGQFYGIRELPRAYLPVLLSIQFTEPFVLSLYLAMILLGWRLLHSQLRTDLVLYIALGFVAPLLALILLNSPLYHNFRQVLFVIPPMFTIAALVVELVFRKLTWGWARVLLILVLAMPGVYSSIKLYPYQYVYYNSLVGGTARVQDRFELDYWRTSLREAALKINERVPNGARIIISGSAELFNRYARADLVVETVTTNPQDLNGGYDYSVQVSRWQRWDIYPNARIEFLIERDNVVLAKVKAVRNASFK